MSASVFFRRMKGKRLSRKRWIIVGSAGVVAVVVVLVLVILRLTAPTLVTAGKLNSALLDTARIDTIMGASDLMIGEHRLAPGKPTSRLTNPECLGALDPAQAPTYAASGYTELRWARTTESGDRINHYVAEAAAIFPDADKANAFVTNSAEHWKACAGQTVAALFAKNKAVVWKLQTVIGDPPKIALSETRQDVDWTCQRAMRAVSNVVVDAAACGFDITDQGSSIADRIAANISK